MLLESASLQLVGLVVCIAEPRIASMFPLILLELGKTPVVVVSAGVKSILDITKTLEVLETHGVPVVSLKSDTEFFTHGTIPSPRRVESEEEVETRMVLSASHSFGEPMSTGMVVAVPNLSPTRMLPPWSCASSRRWHKLMRIA